MKSKQSIYTSFLTFAISLVMESMSGNAFSQQDITQLVADKPAALNKPANSYSISYGNRWTCDRGYYEDNNSCAVIVLPSNAYLNSSGNGWECNRGYIKQNKNCMLIKVPTNAYLTNASYRQGWTCDQGYREDKNTCTKIELPKHAYYVDSNWLAMLYGLSRK